MQKTKSIFSVAILFMLALMIFTGCQVSPVSGPEPQTVVAEEGVKEVDSRATISKFVTEYKRGVVQRLYDYEIAQLLGNPGPSYDTYYYNKDGFKGSLPKDSYTIVSQKRLHSNYWEFVLDICYKGVVTKEVPVASKVVTASRNVTQRLYDYEIAGKLGDLGPSYNTYYYNSGGFKGSIPKVGYTVISSKKLYGNYWEFQLKLNYKGTVYAQ